MVELCKASREEITNELKRREEEETMRKRKMLFEEVVAANEDNKITSIYCDEDHHKTIYHICVVRK